jgi:hypothetical protein
MDKSRRPDTEQESEEDYTWGPGPNRMERRCRESQDEGAPDDGTRGQQAIHRRSRLGVPQNAPDCQQTGRPRWVKDGLDCRADIRARRVD